MLISREDANKRLNSPTNLMNRMRSFRSDSRDKALSLFTNPKKEANTPPAWNPFPENSNSEGEVKVPDAIISGLNIDSIIDDADTRIKLQTIHDTALDTLVLAVQTLKDRLPEIAASKLPDVAAKIGKVVDNIRTEKNKSQGVKQVHLHLYTPEQKKMSDYESVDV